MHRAPRNNTDSYYIIVNTKTLGNVQKLVKNRQWSGVWKGYQRYQGYQRQGQWLCTSALGVSFAPDTSFTTIPFTTLCPSLIQRKVRGREGDD